MVEHQFSKLIAPVRFWLAAPENTVMNIEQTPEMKKRAELYKDEIAALHRKYPTPQLYKRALLIKSHFYGNPKILISKEEREKRLFPSSNTFQNRREVSKQ